jgi:hypothetical protein
MDAAINGSTMAEGTAINPVAARARVVVWAAVNRLTWTTSGRTAGDRRKSPMMKRI